jgi:hypothetical protein
MSKKDLMIEKVDAELSDKIKNYIDCMENKKRKVTWPCVDSINNSKPYAAHGVFNGEMSESIKKTLVSLATTYHISELLPPTKKFKDDYTYMIAIYNEVLSTLHNKYPECVAHFNSRLRNYALNYTEEFILYNRNKKIYDAHSESLSKHYVGELSALESTIKSVEPKYSKSKKK